MLDAGGGGGRYAPAGGAIRPWVFAGERFRHSASPVGPAFELTQGIERCPPQIGSVVNRPSAYAIGSPAPDCPWPSPRSSVRCRSRCSGRKVSSTEHRKRSLRSLRPAVSPARIADGGLGWVETGDQRGISFSEPQFTRLDNICNPPESNRDMTWNCNCAVSIGEKLYKWMPAVKVAVTIPSAKVLQAFQITGEWDGNKTITKTMTKGLSGSIPPGQCGPGEVYCYRSRSYIQTLYRRQLGKVTGVSVVQNPAGTDTVVYSYSYDTCNAPCEGDYSVLEGPPSPWLSFTVYDPDHQPPLADACK